MQKFALITTELQPHQRRAIEKLLASHGLLAWHGVGSGKSLTALAAAEALKKPIDAVMPAALLSNFQKEMDKHTDEPIETRMRSYEKAVRDKQPMNPGSLAVMDEAHRARNSGTNLSQVVGKGVQNAGDRLLLSGTPVYNQPSDLGQLLNIAAGHKVLPNNPYEFKNEFVGQKMVNPGFINRLRGMKPIPQDVLKNKAKLVDAAKGYIDVHEGGGIDYPDRINEEHDVPMSPKQYEVYKFHENKLPWYMKVKIRSGLPMTKAESKDLNAFSGALRQTSNTHRPYVENMTDEEEAAHTPKMQEMLNHLQEMRQKNPEHKGLIYSNYLEGGLMPLSRRLQAAGIPHNVFHGGISKPERAQMVRDYNSGKTPTMLVSSSGSEGLDLKGTRSVQIMEPHWNDSKIEQVIGRGIRYKSHAHLPKDQRNVTVKRYYSSHPQSLVNKIGIGKPPQGIERYMQTSANNKAHLGNQIHDAMQEASDMGPLKQPEVVKAACQIYGVKLAALSPTQAGLLSALVGGAGAAGGAALAQDHPTLKSVAGPALGGALAAGGAGYGMARSGASATTQAVQKAHALKASDLARIRMAL